MRIAVEHQSVHLIDAGFDSCFRLSFHSVVSEGWIIEEDFPQDFFNAEFLILQLLS